MTFLQLDSTEVSSQLTLSDYNIFQAIESTDYIEDLFHLKSTEKNNRLQLFEEVSVYGKVCGNTM